MRRSEHNDGATVQSLKLALARAEERIACQRENLKHLETKNLNADTTRALRLLTEDFGLTVVLKANNPKGSDQQKQYELVGYLPDNTSGMPDVVSKGRSLFQAVHQLEGVAYKHFVWGKREANKPASKGDEE